MEGEQVPLSQGLIEKQLTNNLQCAILSQCLLTNHKCTLILLINLILRFLAKLL